MANIKSIADLRKLKKSQNAGLAAEIDKKMTRKRATDPRFWVPTFGNDGKSNAIIRFLPAHPDEEDTSVKVLSHFYKGAKSVYAEMCRTTIGEDDPCQDLGWHIYNLGGKKNKDRARKFLATEKYYTNIYVVQDENAPENNGRVFIWAVPMTVMKMVKEAAEGNEKKGLDPKDVIGLVDAHNFIVDLYKVGEFPKYDKCGFSGKPTDLFDDDDLAKYQAVIDAQYKLAEFVDPSKFESYEELERKLKSAMGREYDELLETEASGEDDDEDDKKDDDRKSSRDRPSSKASSREETDEKDTSSDSKDDDDDSDDKYYQRIANRRNKR